jgi:HJR/Mrr/RecB family endonuclease
LLWGLLGWLVWRKLAQVRAAERATNLPQGDWRWRPGQSAEQFGAQCRLFLHNHGWRNVQATVASEGAVTLRAQKDRVHMLLHCLCSPVAADATAVDTVAALREAQGCTAACLVTERPADAALRTVALAKGVELIRFADVRFLDKFVG